MIREVLLRPEGNHVGKASNKGNQGERDLQTYLDINGYKSERLRVSGEVGGADLWVPSMLTRIEVKNHRSIAEGCVSAAIGASYMQLRYPDEDCVGVVARSGSPVSGWLLVRLVRDVFPPTIGIDAMPLPPEKVPPKGIRNTRTARLPDNLISMFDTNPGQTDDAGEGA